MGDELFIALAGARAAARQMEVTANNAANGSTTGFKASRVAFELVDETLAGTSSVVADGASAPLIEDGNPFHLGIQGKAWMVVQVGDEELLTRDGSFHLEDGQVVNASGQPLLTDQGPLTLEAEEELTVLTDGRIQVDGQLRGRLLLRDAETVTPVGGNLYRGENFVEPDMAKVTVKQGALESSNTDPVRTMTELIEASRYFEAMQKVLRAADEMTHRNNSSSGGSR